MTIGTDDSSCATALALFNNVTGKVRATALCNCPDTDLFEPGEVDWDVTFDPYLVLYYALLGSLGVMVVLSNLALVVGILRDKRIHQMHNLLVAGQGLSDLAVGIVITVCNLGTLGAGGELIGHETGCNVYGFGIVMTCHSTLFSLCLIAYTRKVRILDNANISGRMATLMYVFGVWGGSIMVLGAYMLQTQARMSCSGSFCNPLWTESVIVMSCFTIGFPIIYTVSVYYRIHTRLLESRRALRGSMDNADANDRYSHNKTTRLMVLMSGTILAMWIPLYIYFIFTIIKTLTGVNFSGFWAVEKLLGISAVASSLCSPLVYGFKNKTLKLAMLYAFCPMAWKDTAAERIKSRAHLKYRMRSRKTEQSSADTTNANRRNLKLDLQAGAEAPDGSRGGSDGDSCCSFFGWIRSLVETRPATVVNESVFSSAGGSVTTGGLNNDTGKCQRQPHHHPAHLSAGMVESLPLVKTLPKLRSLAERPFSETNMPDSTVDSSHSTFCEMHIDTCEIKAPEVDPQESSQDKCPEDGDELNEDEDEDERNESNEDGDEDEGRPLSIL